MFWRKARATYGHLGADDDDIKRYLALPPTFQEDGYRGLVGYIQDIGHWWIARRTPPGPTLEIGFGSGRHAALFAGRREDYYVSEYAERHLQSRAWDAVRGRAVRCDARRLAYRDSSFQTVISIYNLEHIRELDAVLREVHRVLRPGGRLLAALPCEGGLLWNLGRELTTRRAFQRSYGINYDKVIAWEHVWDFLGVLSRIRRSSLFQVVQRKMFPFRLPTHQLNLIACLECSAIK
jgi:SAM-dependent methyltransferase